MSYIPKPDKEGINSSPDHPLKEFSILLVGSLALIGIVTLCSSLIFGEIAVQFAPQVEKLFGSTQLGSSSLRSKETLEKNPALSALLMKLLPAEAQARPPEIVVLCDESPNAFALPGGDIWVTSSLLDMVPHERGLAFVLAHEIGHIQNKDNIRAFGQSMGMTMIRALLGFAEASTALYEMPSRMSYLGLSRNTESVADEFALTRMKKVYNSYAGADEFFKVILQQEKWADKVPAILKTHPDTLQRQSQIQVYLNTETDKKELALHKISHSCSKKP